MAWKVTYDHLENLPCLFGNFSLKDKLDYQFRLYDDDGILYFSGISTDRDSEAAFEPLDHCMDGYGCTEIQYLQDDGNWETL